MRTHTNVLAIACILAVVASIPGAGASTAQPYAHQFIGTKGAVADLHVHTDVAFIHLDLDVTTLIQVESRCVDTEIPGALTFGGTCFNFATHWGDDTGTTQTVSVAETDGGNLALYFVCVDVNGDGVCTDNTSDHTNLCYSNGASGAEGSFDGGACSIYLDPAATLNPAVYVDIPAGVVLRDGTVLVNEATQGFISLG